MPRYHATNGWVVAHRLDQLEWVIRGLQREDRVELRVHPVQVHAIGRHLVRGRLHEVLLSERLVQLLHVVEKGLEPSKGIDKLMQLELEVAERFERSVPDGQLREALHLF